MLKAVGYKRLQNNTDILGLRTITAYVYRKQRRECNIDHELNINQYRLQEPMTECISEALVALSLLF